MARCHLAGLEIRGVHHEGVDGDRLAQQEPTIYLVPDCDGLNQAIEYLGESVGGLLAWPRIRAGKARSQAKPATVAKPPPSTLNQ